MRIAVLVPNRDPNSWYRALLPMETLGGRGHTIATAVVDSVDRIPSFEEMATFDVVYFWRMYQLPLRQVAAALRRRGVAVIWDNDIDLTALPRSTPGYRVFGGLRGQREWGEVRAMIRQVDAVTAPTQALADRYRPIGNGHVHVVDTYLPDVSPRRAPRRTGRVVVGWFTTIEHLDSYRRLRLGATLRRVLELRPEVDLVSVGVRLPLEHSRYREEGPASLAARRELLAGVDVGLAPFADTAYNRAEPTLQVKEYAAVGVPWLASPVGAHAELGPDEGGWLVEDDDWERLLTHAIADPDAREALSGAGHAWAQEQTIGRHVQEWESTLAETVERVRASTARREPASA